MDFTVGKVRENLSKGMTDKAVELMSDVNVILTALPDAGFQIGELEVELGITPKVTVDVRIGQAIREDKLNAVLQANPSNVLLSATLNALLQASKLQQAVSVETLALKDVKIAMAMTATPTVALQWKEKAIAKPAAAA
jgi:anti-sigma factor ChrR (cupin superfamily)